MTSKEYIAMYRNTITSKFFDTEWPELVNGEWTIDGSGWYPCVILDDPAAEGFVNIVTRNQTHTTEPKCKVRFLTRA